MPSFKERFRPSRKYNKNKEAGAATSIDESTITSGILTNFTNLSTTNASTTIDDYTGSAAVPSSNTHYSFDYCK